MFKGERKKVKARAKECLQITTIFPSRISSVKHHVQPCYGISNAYTVYICSTMLIGVSMTVSEVLVVESKIKHRDSD